MVTITDKVSRTFAEYRFLPRLTPTGLNKDSIDFTTKLTKDYIDEDGIRREGIRLKLPVMSAAMQAATGPPLAIALAQQGGLGVYPCSQHVASEAMMITVTKRARAGFVSQLEIINHLQTVGEARDLINRTGYNIIPVVEGNKDDYGRLMGIIEGPLPDRNSGKRVTDVMRPFKQVPLDGLIDEFLFSLESQPYRDAPSDHERKKKRDEIKGLMREYLVYGETGITLLEANDLMSTPEGRPDKKYLPIVNNDGTLKFMVFQKDLQAHKEHPYSLIDANKRYLVGAAVNTHDYEERVPALVKAGVDVIFIDASDGLAEYQSDCIQFIKDPAHKFNIPVVAGNIVTGEAFDYLIQFGIDAIKVGMGGGRICITQEQKGTGRGQATAVLEVAEHRDVYFKSEGIYIPIICDGGLVFSKDIAMALAFGSDAVMMGGYFAGCKESPGELVEGGTKKEYWGEGSFRAKAWLEKRYGQTEFEEGVDGTVPYTGRLEDTLSLTFSKIGATMISCGARTVYEFQNNALVELISDSSRKEGEVHDVEITGKRG